MSLCWILLLSCFQGYGANQSCVVIVPPKGPYPCSESGDNYQEQKIYAVKRAVFFAMHEGVTTFNKDFVTESNKSLYVYRGVFPGCDYNKKIDTFYESVDSSLTNGLLAEISMKNRAGLVFWVDIRPQYVVGLGRPSTIAVKLKYFSRRDGIRTRDTTVVFDPGLANIQEQSARALGELTRSVLSEFYGVSQ